VWAKKALVVSSSTPTVDFAESRICPALVSQNLRRFTTLQPT
jgi:hypothetical protein